MEALKAKLLTFPSKVVAFWLVVAAIAAIISPANSQNCAAGINDLAVCAPFVVPSAGGSPPKPSQECCNALKGANTNCLCNTYDIISKLPGNCNLPPVACGA